MDQIELSSGGDFARISLKGGELMAWSVEGTDLLWTPDKFHWDRTAPLLFPVCGWTNKGQVHVGGHKYELGVHGFAADEPFVLADRGEDFVHLVLRDNPRTRRAYPFAFEFGVTYRLRSGRLSVELDVTNTGKGAMPYACGLHPGFKWPLAAGLAGGKQGGKDYGLIRFDEDESDEVPRIAPGGLFSNRKRTVPLEGRVLALEPALFKAEALCFLDTHSHGFALEANGRRLRIETENLPHFVVWTRPDAPFLCLENWGGYGDPEGFEGDLFAKPSMIILPPGGVGHHRSVYRFGSMD